MSLPIPEPDRLDQLSSDGQRIVGEELEILHRVHERLVREANTKPEQIEDLDAQLIELRDAIAEAKEEDVASLIDQMHQVAALSRTRGQGRDIPIDPKSPYFGHLRIREARTRRVRDVLVGKHTLLDDGDGVTIVDWRNAPVSRLYYRYEEEDEYEEEFDERSIEGDILIRRSLAVMDGDLRRVSAPQGTYVSDRRGRWRDAVGGAKPTLAGGVGAASRVSRSQLGVHSEDDAPRADKHLQEITALIDREQFTMITQPESGIVLIQGGAGSGKTTVALHRVAYLNYQDPARFAPSKMLVVVFNEALVEYIKHVIPSLGVEGVAVTTYRRWSAQLLRRIQLRLPLQHVDGTPDAVSRFKKHPVMIKMIDALVAEQLQAAEDELRARVGEREGAPAIIELWRRNRRLAPVIRVERVLDNLRAARDIPAVTRTAAETFLRGLREEIRDICDDWLELMTNGEAIRAAIAEHAPGVFSDHDINTIVRWCARKADLEDDGDDEDDVAELDGEDEESEGVKALGRRAKVEVRPTIGLDGEDDAIILRLLQVKHGGIFVGNRRFEYEHIVIDEAQDLCPLEVRVLLDCVSDGRSVTIAGDRAQKMIFDNGFSDWPQLLADAGLPHVAIQPLKITYRSTRQIMALSQKILGPLHDPSDELVARDGAPVSFFSFTEIGESVAFLAEALRSLMQREPTASVALITRYPQQADVYFESLRIAEVPKLRRVGRQNFTFTPGIDVTDVRQVKGLEFDYVVVLDPTAQNYPDVIESRHLLHIALTRAAHQLWMTCAGTPSRLLPDELVIEGGDL
ncbi:MAG: ATP-binding domain-containing protein [Myxococcales bacterium]|nr:ATP-binding domain-containing protein [Myxococcales bacterium]MCB9704636.1 ATP-binding domain-containing protein [Myxococcales bacterium]